MDYVRVIETEGRRIVDLARRGLLEAKVPHIPNWTMQDVVAHLGGVHRWATEIVRTLNWEGRRHRKGTETGEALVAWFEEGLGHLVDTFSQADPEAKCGNFSPGSPNVVGFWLRRQAHETSMHRWDVGAAAGVRDPFDPSFATDGIDEVFHTFTRSRGKQVLEAPVGIRTDDTGGEWTLSPAEKPGRIDVKVGIDGPVEATLHGPAEETLLVLWKRLGLDEADIEIEGDRSMIERMLTGPVSP